MCRGARQHRGAPWLKEVPRHPGLARCWDYTAPTNVIAKTGPAFQGEPAALGTILSAGAVVVLIAVVFLSLLALIRLVLVR